MNSILPLLLSILAIVVSLGFAYVILLLQARKSAYDYRDALAITRDDAPQQTDVIAISAELLQVANEGDMAIASVRFTGQLRENNGVAEAVQAGMPLCGNSDNVDEVLHAQKNLRDEKSVWLLAWH